MELRGVRRHWRRPDLLRARWAMWLLLGILGLSPLGSQAAEPLCSTDIDGNGSAAPASDGVLLIRHLFGLSGAALTTGALGSGCTRCSAADIAAHLETLACQVLFDVDVDGDGRRDALSDGLLVWRHLAGYSGSTLVAGALSEGAQRTDGQLLSDWLAAGVQPAGEAPWRVELVAAAGASAKGWSGAPV